MLGVLPDCVQIADAIGTVVALNPAAIGLARASGHDVGSLWPSLWRPLKVGAFDNLSDLPEHSRHLARVAGGDARTWDLAVARIGATAGLSARWLVSAREVSWAEPADISDIDQRHLKLALEGGKMGTWELDLASLELTSSQQCKLNNGRAAGDEFSYRELAASIHPEDLERWRDTVAQAAASGADFNMEYRTIWSDGQVHWAYVRGSCTLGSDGKARAMTGISQDITERKLNDERLGALAIERQRIDQLKTEFLATLGHELRNPLAPIRNCLHVLSLEDTDLDRRRQIQGVMERQVDHMTHLINDLMDVARIERGQIELKRKHIDLRDAARVAVEAASPLIESRGHSLRVDLPGEPLPLDADPTRLAQMIANLLNNAAKYTPEGGAISLSARAEGAEACVEVEDDGMGLSEDALGRVFEMFGQASEHKSLAGGGLGIGLALVKTLARLHGGSLVARSPGEGLGATFVLRLPTLPSSTLPALRSKPVASRSRDCAPRVLIVDDNVDAGETLARVLEAMGYSALTAYDGPGALSAAREQEFDVAILDLGLPGMGGHDLARELRSEHGSGLALVCLSGWAPGSEERGGRAFPFDHRMTKPANLAALQDLLARLAPGRSRAN